MKRQPHARPARIQPDETLAELFLGGAAIVLVFIFFLVLLPVLVG